MVNTKFNTKFYSKTKEDVILFLEKKETKAKIFNPEKITGEMTSLKGRIDVLERKLTRLFP